MDNNDWDLYAVVRSCSVAAAAVSDPFSSFPAPLLVAKEESLEEGKDEIFGFPDLMGTSTSRFELDELCKPFYIKPQQQQQRQPKLVPKPSYPSSSAAASVFPVAATIPYQFQQQPRQPHRSVSQTPRSKRRKNQQKKVVCEVPAVDGVSSDMWAWRKYGQKPIKGSPYPRGYYRCSSSKGCQARKQVERSRADPGMLIITYTAEHNHPVPTHRNSLSGSTRQKFPPPNSASGCGGDGEQLLSPRSHPSSSPLSSPAAAPRLSPTTPLTDSFESELFQPQRPRRSKGYGEEELLTVGDMEMMGEDEMVFLGMEVVDGLTTTAGANKSPATVSVSSTFSEEDGSFEEHFFRPPWLANNNAAAAAGGS